MVGVVDDDVVPVVPLGDIDGSIVSDVVPGVVGDVIESDEVVPSVVVDPDVDIVEDELFLPFFVFLCPCVAVDEGMDEWSLIVWPGLVWPGID